MTDAANARITLDAIRSTRSMRRVEERDIPDEVLHEILDAAIRAPSGSNQQTWSFIVIRDPTTKAALQKLYAEVAYRYFELGPLANPSGTAAESATSVRRSAQYLADNLHKAPVLVMACIRGDRTFSLGSSIYPAVQNLMIAARALGVGSTLTTFHLARESEVKALLRIPEDVHTAALIPLGYPTGRWGEAKRNPVEEIVYRDRFGEEFWPVEEKS